MNIDEPLTWGVAGAVALAAFAAGLARARFPRAPLLATVAIVAGYVGLLVGTGIWWATCPSCGSFQSYDSGRALDFAIALFWGFGLSVAIVGITWFGAAIGSLLPWRHPAG